MSDWLTTARMLSGQGTASALITVVSTKGSSPRAAGTRMLVTDAHSFGTIGGGQLEYAAVDAARKMLEQPGPVSEGRQLLHEYRLGPEMRQCCGGVVTLRTEMLVPENVSDDKTDWTANLHDFVQDKPCVVVSELSSGPAARHNHRLLVSGERTKGSLGDNSVDEVAAPKARQLLNDWAAQRVYAGEPGSIEVVSATDGAPTLIYELVGNAGMHVMLFGAGHVGKALVKVLSGLPCQISWIDSREHEFPADIPPNVTVRINETPEQEVAHAGPDSYFLVMTHSHPMDFQICKAVLSGEFAYLGLIGSVSKRRRFEKNLLRQDLTTDKVARLTCPIGIDTIGGKHPAAIAVAVAAQLLQIHEQGRQTETREATRADRPRKRRRVSVRS